jgi:hypothetical protein
MRGPALRLVELEQLHVAVPGHGRSCLRLVELKDVLNEFAAFLWRQADHHFGAARVDGQCAYLAQVSTLRAGEFKGSHSWSCDEKLPPA